MGNREVSREDGGKGEGCLILGIERARAPLQFNVRI